MNKHVTKFEKPPHYFIYCFIVGLGGNFFGFTAGILVGVLPLMVEFFSLEHLNPGIIVAVPLLSAAVGSLLTGRLLDLFGRKPILVFTGALYAFGILHTMLADHVNWFFFGQVCMGVAIGMNSFTLPVYCAEISPSSTRGAMIFLVNLNIALGFFYSFLVSNIFFSTGDWRVMYGLGLIPTALFLIGTLFLPESPRYLFLKENSPQRDRTLEHLTKCRSINAHVVSKIRKTVENTPRQMSQIFRKPIAKVLGFSVILSAVQQCTGINAILYFAPDLLAKGTTLNEATSLLIALGLSLVTVLFHGLGLIFVDLVGRRPLFVGGLVGMMLGHLFIAYGMFSDLSIALNIRIALVGIFIFIAGFSFSAGPVSWIYVAELMPLGVRGWGTSFSAAIIWISGPFVLAFFEPFVTLAGNGPIFLILAFMSFLTAGLVYLMGPETAGVPLETIEEHLLHKRHIRELGL